MLTKQLRLNICQCVREKHRKELESENMDSSCEAASNSRASKDMLREDATSPVLRLLAAKLCCAGNGQLVVQK